MQRRCRILIKGRVQGVGFRWALCDEAQKLGITGWVRNVHYDAVEALLLGNSDAVDALIAWAHCGPSAAHVKEVHCQDEPESASNGEKGLEHGFAIRSSR